METYNYTETGSIKTDWQDNCNPIKQRGGQTIMETQQNWLDVEIAELSQNTTTQFEKLPSLKLLPNKITEIEVDFSAPFQKWNDSIHKSTKAIIPITSNGVKMNFWLNVKNPLYGQICNAGKNNQTKFKIIQTGTAQDTKYNLVD